MTAAHPGRWRAVTVALLMAGLGLAVIGRVVTLQSEEARSFLQQQGDARTVRSISINAARGVIYDRRGEALAVSTPVTSVWANPRLFDAAHPAVPELARQLGYDTQALTNRINRFSSRSFVYLRRHLAPDAAAAIADLDVPGVDFEDEYKRFYPAGEIAAHVVGITNIDDAGIEGLELAYDEWLSGSPGRKRVIRDRRGRVVRDLEHVAMAEPGQDLTLSMDLRLQYLAYRELKAAMTQYRAESGTVVVLDVETGEVLAMVNQPAYNPNAPVTSGFERLRNRAVTDLYEPGSTVKPLTVAAALETGRFRPEQIIDTSPGWIRVGDKIIRDPLDRGPISLGQIIAKSSQVGISHIALALEEETLRDLYARFGFGVATGVGFPGEVAGMMPDPGRWPDIERVTFAFGYGLAVTPLQLAQAYMILADRGQRRDLSLLRVDEAPAAERVLSPVIAAQVAAMLEGVVRDEGTAARAAIPGYRVAGKTGTVRKVGEQGYDAERHLAYFAGFAPASAPRVAALVLINEPQGEQVGGGSIAAPVFSRVVGGALRLLNVPPDSRTPQVRVSVADPASAAPLVAGGA